MRLPAKQLIDKPPAEQRAGVLDVIRKRALLAALIVAACLRLVGISRGLPGAAHSDSYHPDEGTIYGHAANMADTGDLNPHFFNYGSLPIMLSAVILKLSGAYVPQRIAMGLAALRLLSVVAGVVTAWLAAFIAGRLFRGGWAPAIAAFGVAVAPLAVVNSHYATVDALAACLLTASFACAVRILDEDSRRWYLLAGLLAGLAAASKYVGILAVLPPLAAHAIRCGSLRSLVRTAAPLVVIAGAAIGFLIGCPYSVLDSAAFLRDVGFEMRHVREGATTYLMGQAPLEYFALQVLPCAVTMPLLCVAAIGLAFGVATWRARGALLAGWFLLLTLAHGAGQEIFVRYAMPLVPLLAVAVAGLVAPLDAPEAQGLLSRPFQRYGALGVVTLALVWAGLTSWANVALMERPDTRDQAALDLLPEMSEGGSLGMHGLPWFHTPPLLHVNGGPHYPERVYFAAAEELGIELTITGWNVGVLELRAPEWFVASEFDYHFPLLTEKPEAVAFYAALDDGYALERVYSEPLRAGPIRFERPRLHDWRYVSPDIRVYRLDEEAGR